MCGKELASIRRALASDQAFLRLNVARPHLSPDITAAGLAVMVAHAMGCQRGRVALEYQGNAGLSELTASYLPRSR